MRKSYRFVIQRTGQTMDLVLDIDMDAVAEEMARRAALNKTWKSQTLFGTIKAEFVEVKE